MKIGLTLPQAGERATKDNIVDTAKKAEKEGFDPVWVLERVFYPMKPQKSIPWDAIVVVEHKGEYYSIPPSIIGPKPVQKPDLSSRIQSKYIRNDCKI